MSDPTTTGNSFFKDESLKKADGDASRAPRESADVQRQDTDGTVASRSERRKAFLDEWQQQALPTPPEIPGFHLCWLSSTSSYDPIHKRMRFGYEPVKPTEVPGFDAFTLKSGEFKGFISANEMLLFKVPNERYQEIMEELHYYQPLEAEETIKRSLPEGKPAASGEDDGFSSLGKAPRVPTFN